MFAGSCIGVICLVISLEFLCRLGKECDQLLLRNAHEHRLLLSSSASTSSEGRIETVSASNGSAAKGAGKNTQRRVFLSSEQTGLRFRPNVLEQAIRALLHMLQFAVAYSIMLLAMYYNG